MPSLQSLVIPAVLSFAVAANARFNLGGNLFGKRLVTNCPNKWTPINYNGQGRCCHGSLSVENDNEPYCCVMDYDYDDYRDARDNTRFSDCFPFCSGTNYGGPTVTWSNEPTCITRVPFSANDYSSIVSSAASEGRSATTTTGPATNDAYPTSTYSGDSSYSTDSGYMNPTSTRDYNDDSTRNAAPVATAGGVLGGAAIAAALLAL